MQKIQKLKFLFLITIGLLMFTAIFLILVVDYKIVSTDLFKAKRTQIKLLYEQTVPSKSIEYQFPKDPTMIPDNTCVKEGGGYSGFEDTKRGIECCEGLTNVSPLFYPDPDKNNECIYSGVGANYICIACGDGKCGLKENKCNCPNDCR